MPITLPGIDTDAGVLSRLLIAESWNPASPGYNAAEVGLGLAAMKAVVVNRLANHPAQFGAPGAVSWTDIIVVPGQFAGFGRASGRIVVAPAVATRIDAVLQRANSGPPGPYAEFVANVLAIVDGANTDPFAGITQVGPVAVVGGSYGWRTSGSSSPRGNFVQIPSGMGGIVAGNQFYTLKA